MAPEVCPETSHGPHAIGPLRHPLSTVAYTDMPNPESDDLLGQLAGELHNFQDTAQHLLPQPGDVPRLPGIDVWGGTLPLNGAVGGDHIIYVDFRQRFDLEARMAEAAAE